MKKLLIGAVALVLLGACSKKNVEISGELKGLADTKAVLNKIDGGRPAAIDTVEAKGGKFLFKLPKTDAQLFLVTFEGKQEPIAFFGGDDDVKLTGPAEDFSKVIADGSDMTALFEKFNKEIPKLERSKALRGEYMKAQMGGDTVTMMALRTEYENISQEQKVYFDKFLAGNMNNAVGAFMALNMAGSMEPAKVKEMVVKFEKELKNHPYVAELKKMIEAIDQMEKMKAEQMNSMGNGQPANSGSQK